MAKRIRHVFNSLQEFVRTVDSDPAATEAKGPKSERFYGTSTWSEAMVLAHNGFDSARTDIDLMVDGLKSLISETVELGFTDQFDVSGSYVDVGRFVSGEPECMVESVLEPMTRHGKISKILVDGSYLARVDATSVLRRGVALMTIVELLRIMGQNTEIWVEASSESVDNRSPGTHETLVCIKAAEDSLDINQVAFAICHPAFFRRFVFGMRDIDNSVGLRGKEGYGSSLTPQNIKEIEPDIVLAKPSNSEAYNADWVIGKLRELGLID